MPLPHPHGGCGGLLVRKPPKPVPLWGQASLPSLNFSVLPPPRSPRPTPDAGPNKSQGTHRVQGLPPSARLCCQRSCLHPCNPDRCAVRPCCPGRKADTFLSCVPSFKVTGLEVVPALSKYQHSGMPWADGEQCHVLGHQGDVRGPPWTLHYGHQVLGEAVTLACHRAL